MEIRKIVKGGEIAASPRTQATDERARALAEKFAPVQTELPRFDAKAGDEERLSSWGVYLRIVNGVLCVARTDLPRALSVLNAARGS